MLKKIFAAAGVLLTAIVIGYILAENSSEERTRTAEDIKVNVIDEFPDPDLEVYTNNILKTIKSENYIYLLEHRGGFFLQFDHEGNFIRKISDPGRGPGELINPLDLTYRDGKLYTLEQGKMQVQIFNEEGEYEDAFVFHGAYDGLLVLEDKFLLKNHYYSGMPEFVDMPGREDYPIFTEYFPEQDSTSSFGYYPDFFEELGISTSPVISSIHEKKIYIGYRAFPYILVYRSDGTLDREIKLTGGGFEEVIPRYLDQLPGEYLSIFMDLEVNKKGIFLSAYGEDEEMKFYQFNFSGELVSEYSLANHYSSEFRDLYIRNFAMLPDYSDGKSRLFLTIQGEYPRSLIVDMPL